MYVVKVQDKVTCVRERETERERGTLADEVWEVLLNGKIQGMDSLELNDTGKVKFNYTGNIICICGLCILLTLPYYELSLKIGIQA
jgi:hypothetical protein